MGLARHWGRSRRTRTEISNTHKNPEGSCKALLQLEENPYGNLKPVRESNDLGNYSCDSSSCMYQQMHSSQRIRQPFFVRLSGARILGCNDQQEGGNGIDTSREHSRKLPRCHSGRTCRSECVVSRWPGQHVTWLAGKAGTAARDFPNHAFSSCHQ